MVNNTDARLRKNVKQNSQVEFSNSPHILQHVSQTKNDT